MECSRCGAFNEEQNTFCSECGTILRKEVHTEPPINLNENMDVDEKDFFNLQNTEKLVESESVYQSLDMTQQSTVPNSTAQLVYNKPTKGKGKLIILIILVCLLVLGGLTFLFLPKIANNISPQKYYAMTEKSEIEETVTDLNEIFKRYNNASFKSQSEFKLKTKDSSKFDKEVRDIIENLTIETISIVDSKNKKIKNDAKINYKNETITNFINCDDGKKTSIQIPELGNGQYVEDSQRWITDLVLCEENLYQEMYGISKKEAEKIFKESFEKVILNSFSKEDTVKAKMKFEGKEYDSVTFVINENVQKKMYNSLASELENNKELTNIIKNSIKYVRTKMVASNSKQLEYFNFPTDEEINQNISSLVLELKEKANTVTPGEKIRYTVYYGSGNSIIARELILVETNSKLVIEKRKENQSKTTQIKFLSGSDQVTIANTYSDIKKKIKGEFSITTIDGGQKETFCSLKYNFDKEAKVDDVPVFIGEVQLNCSVPSMIIGESADKFNFNFKSTKQDENKVVSEVDINFNNQGVDTNIGLVGTSVISKEVDSSGIVINDNSTLSATDLEKYKEEKIRDFLTNSLQIKQDYSSFVK